MSETDRFRRRHRPSGVHPGAWAGVPVRLKKLPPCADDKSVAYTSSRRQQRYAVVWATCPTCGDVELTSKSVQIQTCITDGTSTYSFVCPTCSLITNKPASPSVVESLSAAGSRLIVWALPAELAEPKRGPAICHDDLLDFHTALESPDWQAELAKTQQAR